MIKKEILDALDRYVTGHIPTGSFLRAVLENDLMEALGHADEDNRVALYDICSYIYYKLPNNCYGTPAKVKAWLHEG